MNITFKPVDATNKHAVLSLKVKPEQTTFIETVSQCLKEAEQLDLWRPVAIYNGNQLIGFAMYGLFIDEGTKGRVWLDRFLIDEKYQGNGYGKASLKALITNLFGQYSCNHLFLSLYDDNKKATALYRSFGFYANGETDLNGETVMCLNKEDWNALIEKKIRIKLT